MNAAASIYRTEAGGRAVREHYTRLLDAWPLPCERRHLPTRHGSTFVISSGPQDAPPLILLHGSATNSAIWRGDVAVWARRFRVHAVDVLGEPGLSDPTRLPLDSDAHAEWLEDVLDGLGAERASFVGASLGGLLALDFAVRRSARVERLALLCPGGIGRQKYGWLLAALLLKPLGEWGRRRLLRSAVGIEVRHGEFLDAMSRTLREFRPRTERLPAVSDEALRDLGAPLLVIAGERDAMLDSEDTARRLAAVPQATVRLLPGVGHAITGRAEVILDHLRGEETADHPQDRLA